MADEKVAGEATAAVAPPVPTVAPGIPAVEVNPSNELLDGENLQRKADMIENEPVHVDASGTRLEHDDGSVIPPPASANLELRERTEKTIQGMLGSIGKLDDDSDTVVAGLREELRGLRQRADGGDERAGKRVKQVEEQIRMRGAEVEPEPAADAATSRESAAEQRRTAAESKPDAKKAAPAGRQAPGKQQS